MCNEEDDRPGRAGPRWPPDRGSRGSRPFYVAAWVAGLVIGPASLDVTAPDTAVLRAYAESQGAAIAQLVLTQGVAAVALAVVVLALGQAARGRGARRIARRIEVAGLAAVVLSLVQGAYGIRLAGWVAPEGDSARAGRIFEFVSRIDGGRMLLLAIVTVSGMALARQAGALPPRADFPRVMLAAALTGGGVGYLLLSSSAGLDGIAGTAASTDMGGRHGRVAVPGPGSQSNDRQRSANPETR
jgi:hypothetical protein